MITELYRTFPKCQAGLCWQLPFPGDRRASALAFGDCASASSAVLNSRPVYADAFCEYTDVDLTETSSPCADA
jgi:hypothetical protein